ncbi:MAG: ATP phosphoribosyltransferase regulatory subunit [Corticimicrobacter sp.]|uniref:ATP phosphoribosyltransferase regulatory subunit n=1 Tax=Corticimicrobacter sp. TaxID=2678536 RepID=UPI0032DA4788
MKGNWLLPEQLADILPAEARRIEELRRVMLDLYRTYGYELVAPPLVEYIDSLLSGAGTDLNLRTCKLVDQASGRTLGVRADMTPQVARIDAHLLNRSGVGRFCYCGSVFHARPVGLLDRRELLQLGAEIYGHAGLEADLEILRLVMESMRLANVGTMRLDLSHPGVVGAILATDPGAAAQADEIHRLLSEKNIPALLALAGQGDAPRDETLAALRTLAMLYGTPADVLAEARQALPPLPGIVRALDDLQALVRALPDIDISLDLADVGGYGYYSGVMFSLYAEGWHDALVRGGRYDNIGAAFGRARPATGFSFDLRKVAAGLPPARRSGAISAPWSEDPALALRMQELRRQGEIVIQLLPGHVHDQEEFFFDRELVRQDGAWVLRQL